MTSSQAQELSRLRANYKASGKLIEAKAIDWAIYVLRRLDKAPDRAPEPPKVVSRRKPWPPAKRHPMDVMLFGEAR